MGWIEDVGKATAAFLEGVPKWVLFSFGVTSAAFLFAPGSVREPLHMPDPGKVSGGIAGMVLLLSGTPFLYFVLQGPVSEIRDEIAERWLKHKLLKKTRYFSSDDWAVLARYYSEDTRTLEWSITHPAVKSLEARKVLLRVTSMGYGHDPSFAFTVQPWLWEALKDGKVEIPDGIGRVE